MASNRTHPNDNPAALLLYPQLRKYPGEAGASVQGHKRTFAYIDRLSSAVEDGRCSDDAGEIHGRASFAISARLRSTPQA